MKGLKKYLSWLLVAALVVSSFVIGVGKVNVHALNQATGQTAYYRLRVKTSDQDCGGTGTNSNLTVTINYSDGTSNNANTIAGESSPNYFEAGSTDNIVLSPALPAKPISSITFSPSSSERWKTDWSAIDYSNDYGSNWVQIASMGGFDGTGVRTFTYPSTYSLNTSSLNKTLTFDANGGTGGTQIYSEWGATLPAGNIPTVTKTGYTFAGWSPAIPAVGPSVDTTYTAQWSANTYTCYFSGNGGGTPSPASKTVTYAGTYGTLATVSRAGYTFTGWNRMANGSGTTVTSSLTVPMAANHALYAQWSINNCTVTFDANGGAGGTVLTVPANSSLTAPAVSRAGYSFVAWSPSVPAAVPNAASVTYTAVWLEDGQTDETMYTVSFNANGAEGTMPDQQIMAGQSAGLSINLFTRIGYTFSGWAASQVNADLGVVEYNDGETYTMAIGNAALYAVWAQEHSQITFDANGSSGGLSQALAIGSVLTPPAVARDGYTFAGWLPEVPATVPAVDTTYTAQWSAHIYTIVFNANGGSGIMQNKSVAYGQSVTLTTNDFSRTGYTFTGWNTASDGSGTAYSNGQSVLNLTAVNGAAVTLYAQWTAHTYTVVYRANGGSGTTASSIHTYGVAKNLTTNGFTKPGCKFNQWYNSTNCLYYSNGQSVLNLTATDGATVFLDARWTTCYLSFYNNGGTGSMVSINDNGSGVTVPACTFTRTGYTFCGWNTAADGSGISYGVGTLLNLTDIIKLYAQWSVNQYNITFDANGGTSSTGGLMAYGTALTAPAVTRTGYTFTGWSPAVPATVPAADSTYTAQWLEGSWSKLTFNADGGTGGTTDYKLCGAALTAPTVTKSGYTFAGWSPEVPSTVPAEDTTYTALWTVNSYTVNFDAQGGSVSPAASTVTFGSTYGAGTGGWPTPTRTGYVFNGWFTQPLGTEIIFSSTTVTTPADHSIYAVWKYTVAYNGNGSTGGSTSNSSFAYGVSYALRTNGYTKTGYDFAGWATSPDGDIVYSNGQTVSNLVPTSGTTVTLYAKWTVKTYIVTFNPQSGTVTPTSSTVTYNSTYGEGTGGFPTPVRTGYTFSGWYTGTGGVGTNILSTTTVTITAAQTLYAKWTANGYMVTFDPQSGTVTPTSSTVTYNSTYGAGTGGFPTPTRTGYTFGGWYTSTGGAGTNILSTTTVSITAAQTLYANWTASTVNITFVANGGTGGTGPTAMTPGAALTAPTVTRTGYTFSGWTPTVPSTVPTVDSTYVAQWAINQVYLTWDPNGGTWWDGSTGPKTTTDTTCPGFLTRNGYTFSGWSPAPPVTMPAVSSTVTAQWSINYYAITFDANGGTGSTTQSLAYGSALTAPMVTRTGYTFVEWLPAVPSTVPNNNATYTAMWSLNSYTITFDANGGTGGTSSSMAYGAALIAPTVIREGYIFAGWSPEVPATVPAENQTYVAQWTIDLTGAVQFTVSSSEGVSGDIITVSIAISENSNIGAANFELPFDPGLLEYVSASAGAALTSGMADINFDAVNNKIIMTYINTEGLIEAGSVLDVQFRIKNSASPQTINTNFAVVELTDSEAAPLQSSITQGTIVVTCMLGDINGGGSVTVVDALMALQAASGKIILTGSQLLAADVNKDGMISAIDALKILQYASGKITSF